jgi:hypothetical protein
MGSDTSKYILYIVVQGLETTRRHQFRGPRLILNATEQCDSERDVGCKLAAYLIRIAQLALLRKA